MDGIDRRRFLTGCAIGLTGLTATLRLSGSGWADTNTKPFIIDAHSHPEALYLPRLRHTVEGALYTIDQMKAGTVKAAVFCAVGDLFCRANPNGAENGLQDVTAQLKKIHEWVESGKVTLITASSQLDEDLPAPGAILGIEGGCWLEGRVDRLCWAHDTGIRVMTLLHKSSSEIGDFMKGWPVHFGLTAFGKEVVRRMNELGMLIDVAHAEKRTMMDICRVSSRPVIDSHTNPLYYWQTDECRCRFRSWEEMEAVAATGGVVCTWPLKINRPENGRNTLADWAKEVSVMMARLGTGHVGLGTDGSGRLGNLVDGYRNPSDLPKLAEHLRLAGLDSQAIANFMGGNFRRVFKKALS